jgi:hypothetical protein
MLDVVRIAPMRLLRTPEAFDHPEFIFEPKIDGFRALAYVEGRRCRLVSRNGHAFKSWPQLVDEIAHAVRADSAVLGGEICCLDPDRTQQLQEAALSPRMAVLLRLRPPTRARQRHELAQAQEPDLLADARQARAIRGTAR